MLPEVRLNDEDIKEARSVAERHYATAQLNGNKNRHGLGDVGKDKNVQIVFDGYCGELAVSRFLHLPLSPWLERLDDAADLGRAIEVRTTPYPNGRLIWRPTTDHKDRAYILVRSNLFPVFRIVGWATGQRATEIGFYGDLCRMRGGKPREPVWWVEGKNLSTNFEEVMGFYYVPAKTKD